MRKRKSPKRRSMEAVVLQHFKPKRKPSLKVYSRKAKHGKASRKWEAFDFLVRAVALLSAYRIGKIGRDRCSFALFAGNR